MPVVIQESPNLGGTGNIIASPFARHTASAVLAASAKMFSDFGINAPNIQRIIESRNSTRVAQNASKALTSGIDHLQCFTRLLFFVKTGPSNLTIRTLDGNSVTLNALASGTLVNLEIQFSLVTWTGTATAIGFYTE